MARSSRLELSTHASHLTASIGTRRRERHPTVTVEQQPLKLRDYHRMQVWAGQSAAKAKSVPAATLVKDMWECARKLL